MTTIPAAAAQQLRRALQLALGAAAEDVAAVARRPRDVDEWLQPLARLDGHRAVLDVISWSDRDPEPDAGIDLDAHRPAIREAPTAALGGERYLISERGDAAAQQRTNARARAATIEAFMGEIGLEVPQAADSDE